MTTWIRRQGTYSLLEQQQNEWLRRLGYEVPEPRKPTEAELEMRREVERRILAIFDVPAWLFVDPRCRRVVQSQRRRRHK